MGRQKWCPRGMLGTLAQVGDPGAGHTEAGGTHMCPGPTVGMSPPRVTTVTQPCPPYLCLHQGVPVEHQPRSLCGQRQGHAQGHRAQLVLELGLVLGTPTSRALWRASRAHPTPGPPSLLPTLLREEDTVIPNPVPV